MGFKIRTSASSMNKRGYSRANKRPKPPGRPGAAIKAKKLRVKMPR